MRINMPFAQTGDWSTTFRLQSRPNRAFIVGPIRQVIACEFGDLSVSRRIASLPSILSSTSTPIPGPHGTRTKAMELIDIDKVIHRHLNQFDSMICRVGEVRQRGPRQLTRH